LSGHFSRPAYLSLEALDTREFAHSDPRGFLAQYADGAIFDEIQQAPELLNYLQGEVDARPDPGRFILTGSQHFGLSQSIAQSLAGRCGILVLLPPSLEELRAFPNAPTDLYTVLWQGAYPRIYDRNIPAHQWLADYTATYLQRDVRQVINVGDLHAFAGFLKLCAAAPRRKSICRPSAATPGCRTTRRAPGYPYWRPAISSTICRPGISTSASRWSRRPNCISWIVGWRVICWGFASRAVASPSTAGAIFESWVIAEIYKGQVHCGIPPALFHYRETRGLEIDLLIDQGQRFDAIEIKSGATAAPDFFRNLQRFPERWRAASETRPVVNYVVYGGSESQQRSYARLLPWNAVERILATETE